MREGSHVKSQAKQTPIGVQNSSEIVISPPLILVTSKKITSVQFVFFDGGCCDASTTRESLPVAIGVAIVALRARYALIRLDTIRTVLYGRWSET